jgi:5-deoxy-glucuronate isomerase
MPNLLVRPRTDGGSIHAITPQSAGWRYVGFEVVDMRAGDVVERHTGDREYCLVLVRGRAVISAGGTSFGKLGGRVSPFEGAPAAVYVPARSTFSVAADGPVELALCSAPGSGRLPARLIDPATMSQEVRGSGTNTRHVRNILPENEPAESLLVVEVITPGGNWSSYPPHKHDSDRLPDESHLEETYYHRLSRPGGFAFQRVYTDDARSTRRWRWATATWCWCRAATIRSARRTATTSTTSTSWPARAAPGSSSTIPPTSGC